MHKPIPPQYYTELQKLHPFMQFIASLEYTNEKQRQLLGKIQDCIRTFDNPETFRGWNVCLSIIDEDLQNKTTSRTGVYLRRWWIYSDSQLSIEAESEHTEYNQGGEVFKDDFYCFISLDLGNETNECCWYGDVDISDFTADAQQYKKYITQHLNLLEIDISFGDESEITEFDISNLKQQPK